MGMGVLGRGGWARLRRSSIRGRRGRRGRPCAGDRENPEAQRTRTRQVHMRRDAKMGNHARECETEECGGDCNNRTPLEVTKGINGSGSKR
eukprot:1473969-Pleurochrysis_carterae.AAC.1